MANLGGNQFDHVAFPLVVADRFFRIYRVPPEKGMWIDVFRWDEDKQEPIFEVRRGESLIAEAQSRKTGHVVWGSDSEGFLFKFRPAEERSQIFGRIPMDGEISVRINDRGLTVSRDDNPIATVTNSTVSNFLIGVELKADGEFRMGSNELPEGFSWGKLNPPKP